MVGLRLGFGGRADRNPALLWYGEHRAALISTLKICHLGALEVEFWEQGSDPQSGLPCPVGQCTPCAAVHGSPDHSQH